MKVKDLQGKEYTWNLGKYVGNERSNASDLHIRVRLFLEAELPAIQILEEVFIPGEGLYLDFYLPILKVAIEADGTQHGTDTRHFFRTKADFYKAQSRDRRKTLWCEINHLKLLRFYKTEDESIWRQKMETP